MDTSRYLKPIARSVRSLRGGVPVTAIKSSELSVLLDFGGKNGIAMTINAGLWTLASQESLNSTIRNEVMRIL